MDKTLSNIVKFFSNENNILPRKVYYYLLHHIKPEYSGTRIYWGNQSKNVRRTADKGFYYSTKKFQKERYKKSFYNDYFSILRKSFRILERFWLYRNLSGGPNSFIKKGTLKAWDVFFSIGFDEYKKNISTGIKELRNYFSDEDLIYLFYSILIYTYSTDSNLTNKWIENISFIYENHVKTGNRQETEKAFKKYFVWRYFYRLVELRIYDKAILIGEDILEYEYNFKSLTCDNNRELKETESITGTLNKLLIAYYETGDLSNCYRIYEKALDFNYKLNNIHYIAEFNLKGFMTLRNELSLHKGEYRKIVEEFDLIIEKNPSYTDICDDEKRFSIYRACLNYILWKEKHNFDEPIYQEDVKNEFARKFLIPKIKQFASIYLWLKYKPQAPKIFPQRDNETPMIKSFNTHEYKTILL